MSTLTQSDRDKLTKAYVDAMDRHLRYMTQQQATQATTIKSTQPAKP